MILFNLTYPNPFHDDETVSRWFATKQEAVEYKETLLDADSYEALPDADVADEIVLIEVSFDPLAPGMLCDVLNGDLSETIVNPVE